MKQLTLSILLMLLPLLASADPVEIDGIWYNLITKGKVAEVTNNHGYSGDLKIPEKVTYDGLEYSVTSIGDYAFQNCSLTSITIPNSVTNIGSHSFQECTSLTSITIPNSVTSISNYAFYGCSGLTSITIPNSVTSICEWAFYGCSSLTSFTIPNSVMSIGEWAFYGCSSLTSITIPNSVTSISNDAFSYCSSLTSITIPNSVTSIGYSAFYNCTGLTSITIPNSVTSIGGGAFEYCTGLTSITIPNSVTRIGSNAFAGCKELTSITIPTGLSIIYDGTFTGCKKLTSVIIPNNIREIQGGDTDKLRGAFQDCTNLRSITLGTGISSIGDYSFKKCGELTDIFCTRENVPSANINAFEGSYPQYITLHVPASSIEAYKATEPWKNFKEIVSLSGDTPVTPKCATPTISIENGKVKFSCETEGVEFVSSVSSTDTKDYYDAELALAYKYKVSVYAVKEGYENSDTATAEITATGKFGDMNHDNKITVADAVIIIDKVMKNEE